MKNNDVIGAPKTTKQITFQFASFSDLVKTHKLAAVSASSLVKSLQANMSAEFEEYLKSLAIVGKFENKPLPSMPEIIECFKELQPNMFVRTIAINSDGSKIDGLSLLPAIKKAAKVDPSKWAKASEQGA